MPMIVANKSTGNFTPAPQGWHNCVCTQILDMGMQPRGQFGDKRVIRIAWESDQKMDNGEPFLINQVYTLSLNEKATLRQHLEQWRDRPFTAEELNGFDLEKLLGVGCRIRIKHNEVDDRIYANIVSLDKLPKAEWPKPTGELVCFSADDPDMKVLERLPEWLGDKITTGLAKLKGPGTAARGEPSGMAAVDGPARTMAEELEDEIPF